MNRRPITLKEYVGLGILFLLLVSVLVPIAWHPKPGRDHRCANNLRQLYKLGTVYAASHGGEWPDAQGEDLWLFFTKTIPPLIEADQNSILLCPILGDYVQGETHYRGPRGRGDRRKLPHVLGADKVGNHGPSYGGNVLLGDGSVQELKLKSDLWGLAASTLTP